MHAPATAATGHRPRATPTAIIAVTASSGEVETLTDGTKLTVRRIARAAPAQTKTSVPSVSHAEAATPYLGTRTMLPATFPMSATAFWTSIQRLRRWATRTVPKRLDARATAAEAARTCSSPTDEA